jgi:uncharacterized membrane protein
MRYLFKNANIGLGVLAVIMTIGLVFFHDSNEAWQAVVAVSFVVGFAVMFVLNHREDRIRAEQRHKNTTREPPSPRPDR